MMLIMMILKRKIYYLWADSKKKANYIGYKIKNTIKPLTGLSYSKMSEYNFNKHFLCSSYKNTTFYLELRILWV